MTEPGTPTPDVSLGRAMFNQADAAWAEVARLRAALQEVRDDVYEMWSMEYAREMDRRFGTVPKRVSGD